MARASWAVWLVVLASSGMVGGAFASAGGPVVELDSSERVYLDVHDEIVMCVDPDWWPFETIDEAGQHIGIAADLIALVAERTGISIRLLVTENWQESLAASQTGECKVLSFLNRTVDRERWLIFTEPLLRDPNVLITRQEHPFISDVGELEGKTIALPTGTAMAERFKRDFPHIEIVYTETEQEALQLVSDGEVDMSLRSLIVAAYTIRDAGWFNLKISGEVPGYGNELRMGVIRSEETLRDILDKGIATISTAERRRIIDNNVSIEFVTEVVTDYTLLYWVVGMLLAVLLTSLAWMLRMRQLNRRFKTLSETDALTGLPNRNGLDVSFTLDLQRAQRYDRPLSVLMLDLDHFKQINDEYGHLVGDRVLIHFATLLRDILREVDVVSRWGGEEFLIVCNETTSEDAVQLADRIRIATSNERFPCPDAITVSAGVSSVVRGDTVDTLVGRADQALYEAKRAGRDRVAVKFADQFS